MFRAGNQQNSLYIMRKTNQSVLGTLCSSTACEGVLGTKPQVHFLPGKFTFARCLRPKPIIHQRINPSPTSQPNIPALDREKHRPTVAEPAGTWPVPLDSAGSMLP